MSSYVFESDSSQCYGCLGSDGIPDANPEAIQVGEPLDGSDSPAVAVGVELDDITGVIAYQSVDSVGAA